MFKNLRKQRWLQSLLLGLLGLFGVVIVSILLHQPNERPLSLSTAGEKVFVKRALLSNVQQLFDLGVVDINADGALDIYTSNHSAGQFLLIGTGDGQFSDNQLSKFSLNQDPEFPGLADFGAEPVIDKPGFYIYWRGRDLVLQTHQLENTDSVARPLKGQISFSASVEAIQQNRGFELAVQTQKLSTGADVSTVQFVAEAENAKLVIRPFNVSIPITFKLDSEIPINQIYIGYDRVSPPAADFSLYLRDRHGMAWSDYNSDGLLDVFIVRGGLRARMNELPERYTDELLIASAMTSDTRYQNKADELSIVKDGCPALQPAWIDFDNDQRMDIYVTCFKPLRATRSFPNQLYQQQPDGTFVNVAAEANLDVAAGGTFTWLDADADGDADLFWIDAEAFWLYRNESGKFNAERIGLNPGGISKDFSSGYKLTLADYDQDGDFDLFFASVTGNALLSNINGQFQVLEVGEVGLPGASISANWVDYNNDGLVDLHAVPNGIYQQQANHAFQATGLLASESPSQLASALASWFDSDGDGDRDLLVATQYKSPRSTEIFKKIVQKFIQKEFKSAGSEVSLYENLSNDLGNRWLQIDLVGPAYNRQAIGAQVEVATATGRQYQIVGQSEGSNYSQGHYRLYFGLGQQEQIDQITVTWPPGESQRLQNIESNQLLRIEYAS